ncbi:MAG: TonB-dependent receptor [Deltaproteobacteria bacterium]|jgi:hemoglobin/transferrin/lactoferrin receptor protein|nr:TonB-dependent receptor [Deltaproteobacteria bacterium]
MKTIVKKEFLTVISLTVLTVLIFPASSSAQLSPPETPMAVEPIMVTATRSERDLMQVPMSVSVVTEQEIEERYPGSNTAEKMRDVPGVSYAVNRAGPGNNGMLILRGQIPMRVLYLIDGINQNSVFKDDQNKGLLTIDPSDIERIEIIKGPASSLYGSEAIGGVVNVITKKGGDGRPFGGRADLVYDNSNDGYTPHLAIYGDTESYRYRVSGSFQKAGDRRAAKVGRLDHSDFSTESVFGNFGYISENGELDITFNHYDSDVNEANSRWYGDPLYIAKYLPYGDPDLTELSMFPENRRDTIVGKLVLRDLIEHLDRLTFRLYHQRRNTKQLGVQYPATNLLSSLLVDKTKTFGAYLQGDLSLGDHEINIGLDFVHDQLLNESEAANREYGFFESKQATFAAFIQDVWHIADPLTLTTGIRYTRINSHQGRLDAFPESANKSYSFENVVGNAGLVYMPWEVLSLRLQYSQGFRAPDLASKLTGTGGYLMPFPDLKPEKSQSYEFGVRYSDNNLFIDAAVFYSKVKDFIASKYLGIVDNHFYWRMKNAAEYTTVGFELGASWRIFDTGFTAYGGYTYLDGKLKDHESGTTSKGNATPRSWGSVGLKWDSDASDDLRVFADATFRAAAKRSFISNGVLMNKYRSGKTMDFNLGFDYGEDRRLKVVLAVKNLFDEEYEPSYYNYPARHFVLSAAYLF